MAERSAPPTSAAATQSVPATRRPRNPHRAETRQPTVLRRVHVRAVDELAPGMVRLTLGGGQLRELAAGATDTGGHTAGAAVPAVQKAAAEKFKRISAAYDRISRKRGI